MENWKNKKWIIGVSGGADSMSLLDTCYRENIDVIVAHVNYHKRESANRDMEGVETYCKERNIPFYVKHIREYNNDNFQAQARDQRYAFFKELKEKYHAYGVLSAHQKDDVIETYIMQTRSHRIPMTYGINEISKWDDLLIYRPFLMYTKQELLDYCIHNNVPHFMDESNLTDHYERNKIRHTIIDKMNDEDKDKMILEIYNKNKELESLRNKVMNIKDEINISDLLNMDVHLQTLVLRTLLENNKIYHTSEKTLRECILKLKETKKNFKHDINNEYMFVCEYNKIYVMNKNIIHFSYTLHKIEYIKNEYFTLKDHGLKIEGVYIKESDFPITIRNVEKQDCIDLRFGTKKVNRFFIDRKILYKDRIIWPVIVNKNNEVIFVKGIGSAKNSYNNGQFNMYLC